jgi:hypothetical protein
VRRRRRGGEIERRRGEGERRGRGREREKRCDILAQDLIELIEYLYRRGTSFSEAYLVRTYKLNMLGLEQFGMSDRPGSFLGCA